MKIKKIISFLVLIALSGLSFNANAQDIEYTEQYYRGQVTEELPKGENHILYLSEADDYQTLRVEVLQGPERGDFLDLNYVMPMSQGVPQALQRGDLVVLMKTDFEGDEQYHILEPYRLSALFWLTLIFVIIAVAIAGKKGVSALLGLGATLLILIGWIVPRLVSGENPLWVSAIGVVLIAIFSFYLSHGFKRRTSLALISTLFTLMISAAFAVWAVSFTQLFGLGSEEAASLGISLAEGIDLKGLLLGAIVIGTLGVLDDITTAQVAVVEELKKANGKLHFADLFERAMSVGKEHITALINTLVIAYAGATLPVFLLFTLSSRPFWVILNNEFLAEEVVRTLVGSSTLILSVPLTTLLAAWYYCKYPQKLPEKVERPCCLH